MSIDVPTEVGGVPADWEICRLLDHVSLPEGQLDPTRDPYRDWPLIAPDHIESNTGQLLALMSAADQGAASGKYGFEPDDVLYSKIRPYLRKAVLAEHRGLCSADMYPLRPGPRIVPRFLLALVLGEHFSRFAEAVSMRSGFPKINREELGEYRAAIPTLPEQLRIAEILDTLDAAIARTEALIAKLKQVKAGLINDLLSRERSNIGDRAHHGTHELAPFGSVIVAGPQNGLYVPESQYQDSGNPIVRIDSFDNAFFKGWHGLRRVAISDSDRRRYGLARGDILINRVNTLDLVGKSVLVSDPGETSVFESNIMRLRVDAGRLLPEYAALLLASDGVQRQFRRRAKSAIAQASINQNDVRSCEVRLPPLDQQAIVLRITTGIDEHIRMETKGLEKFRHIKAGMMDDLLTGRVRVNSA